MTAQPGTGAVRHPSAVCGPRRASLEVQIHPADIRRRVRYFFFGRAGLTLLSLAALLYILFLALAAALAAPLLREAVSGGEYQMLVAERARLGQRTQELVRRLDEIADRGADLGLYLARVRLAYGLPALAQPRGPHPAEAGEAATGSIYAGAVTQGRRLGARLARESAVVSTEAAALARFEREHPEAVATTPSVCPLPAGSYVLTTPFARVRSPFTKELEFHAGVDLAAPSGTPVRAPADGVVTFAGSYPAGAGGSWWRLGRLVVLAHGERFATVFGHLDRIDVRPGQRLRRGAPLGTVGTSGWSTHPHLHYEVRRLGSGSGQAGERPLDPRLFVLDERWSGEERLLAEAAVAPPGTFDPLPALRRARRRR
jgi:murein DD-endopeptidase MepM/ murein hydrolase activator NlpD